MRTLQASIIGLSFSLLTAAGAFAAEPESLPSRVNCDLQERIEFRMQTLLEQRSGFENKVMVPVETGWSSQVRGETDPQVEITDCPCDNLPLAG